MRRIRIESESHELIAGFVTGVEWVNDSALTVVDLESSCRPAFAVLEDQDGSGENKVLRLSVDGLQPKE